MSWEEGVSKSSQHSIKTAIADTAVSASCMQVASQASSGAECADMMQQELALLQEGPSDSNDTMADDSDEPLGQDLGLQFGGFDMQPEHEPPSKTVSIPDVFSDHLPVSIDNANLGAWQSHTQLYDRACRKGNSRMHATRRAEAFPVPSQTGVETRQVPKAHPHTFQAGYPMQANTPA